MIAFAIGITFSIVTIDFLRISDQTIADNQFQLVQTEKTVNHALQTVEKAYYLFDNETEAKMKENSLYLANLYKEQPDFSEWDFDALYETMNMDIYIIDENNTIIYSNLEEDVGLDFNACCESLARIMDERRENGNFYADGMDMEQSTGKIKKFSYMPTHDKKYVIELGYSLEDDLIFQEFNFIEEIENLVQTYDTINEINVLNMGGLALGNLDKKLPKDRRDIFKQVLVTQQPAEISGTWNDTAATYRYVPFTSEYDDGSTKHKVIEIVYDQEELESILNKHKKTFVLQLIVILILATVISFLLSRWLSKPIYYAHHDGLTGLKNRAVFEETLREQLTKKDVTALFMLDMDNFKRVNDQYGHDKGDYLLKKVAHSLQNIPLDIRKDMDAFRIGGDEFAIIIPSTSKKEVIKIAQTIINALRETINEMKELKDLNVTISIGISLSEKGIDTEKMYKQADMALYESKAKGKNQYYIFSN